MIRKYSKTTKKGFLEKIYKEYTLPLVFQKNNGICVVCHKNQAESGHHIFGREKDYLHIHHDFVVPVCNWCHSKEKSLNLEERMEFKKVFEGIDFPDFDEFIYKIWAYDKLKEFGFKER